MHSSSLPANTPATGTGKDKRDGEEQEQETEWVIHTYTIKPPLSLQQQQLPGTRPPSPPPWSASERAWGYGNHHLRVSCGIRHNHGDTDRLRIFGVSSFHNLSYPFWIRPPTFDSLHTFPFIKHIHGGASWGYHQSHARRWSRTLIETPKPSYIPLSLPLPSVPAGC